MALYDDIDEKSQEGFFATAGHRGVNDDVFDHFLMVFKRVLVDRGVAHGRIHECLKVFESARGQVLNR